MKNPLVSVVIPVYNVERYIEQCLASVRAQTYSNLEIIVVDDASPDNSIALIETIEDARIKIVRQANRGLAGARNTGIRTAQGEFVAFLDSDDFWHPDKISRHVAQMSQNPEIGVSFSASMFVDENGVSLNRRQEPAKKSSFTADHIFCRNPIGNGSAPVLRKDILDAIAYTGADKDYLQYFDERLRQSEDIECWVRIALQTQTTFAYIDQPLTYYRLNGGGLSANVDKQFMSWEFVLEKLQAYAPQFARRYGDKAKAFQYRYLARRLIIEGNTDKAATLMFKALNTHMPILWNEPLRTWSTLAASFGLSLVPKKARLQLIQKLI